MKPTMNFIRVKNFLSSYMQTILLIIGLILINLGVLVLLNVGSFLVCTGLSMIAVAFLINYEREEVKQ